MIEKMLVKYCFFENENSEIEENIEEYCSAIIKHLEANNIIRNIKTRLIKTSPFDDAMKEVIFFHSSFGYKYSFKCNEERMLQGNKANVEFSFDVNFVYETHREIKLLYVEIGSTDYVLSLDSVSNCLDILKHTLRQTLNKTWKKRYCLVDKQSAFYATQLYPRIHEIENLFREYINEAFIKIFGANWWNTAIAAELRSKAHIDDTRDYAGKYADIEPYLLSIEIGDLRNLTKIKKYKWNPMHSITIENIINKNSKDDIITELKKQCSVHIDIWEICFGKYLPHDFDKKWSNFEKRRNQIAHNKLMDFHGYSLVCKQCGEMKSMIQSAFADFKKEYVSMEEQEAIDEYMAEMEEAEQESINATHYIAQEESGVNVYSNEEILELFNETLESIYDEINKNFIERSDLYISKYSDVNYVSDEQFCFQIKYLINENIIDIFTEVDINDSQGDTSLLKIIVKINNNIEMCEINFTNGEYSFNWDQSNYMPETQDELDLSAKKDAIRLICSIVDDNFENLREKADLYNHLDAMAKASTIVAKDIYCSECGEEYICVDEETAPTGKCLNCGSENHIYYCTICNLPVEAVSGLDFDTEPRYCDYHYNKLFVND